VKKKFPWLIAGGLAVAGGVAAALLLGGGEKEEDAQIKTIGVISPSGGDIWYKGFEVDITWNSSALFLNSFGVNSIDEGIDSISGGLKGVSSFKRKVLKKDRFFKSSLESQDKLEERNRLKGGSLEKTKSQGQIKESSEFRNRETTVPFREKELRKVQDSGIKGVDDIKISLSIHKKNHEKGMAQAEDISDLYVRIELYKGGNLKRTITSSTENDGSYSWTVPHSLADGKDYKVRISSVEDSSVYAESGYIEIKKILEWIEIPAGWFKMGDDIGLPYEKPVHNVYLDAYYISEYEVTHEQYIFFLNEVGVNSNGSYQGKELVDINDSDCAIGYKDGEFYFKGSPVADTKNTPLIEVTWYGGKEFCDWLSQETGEDIHLPTEAQWEKAARGTDQRRYPWGNSSPNNNLANYGNNVGKTMPVGSYPAGKSPYGVYDMAGNVSEWCQDWFDGNYYEYSPSHNPQGPSSGTYRLQRGGHWGTDAYNIRSTRRLSSVPFTSYGNLGFRPAKEK
jgi:formylglycine-generating enzyme required for sulfatase activity